MKEIKDKLLTLRESLIERLDKIKNHKKMAFNEIKSEDDLAQLEQNEEIIDSLNEKERIMLKQIDNALERIDNDTFGICLKCDDPIEEKRIKAIPYAPFCKDCSE